MKLILFVFLLISLLISVGYSTEEFNNLENNVDQQVDINKIFGDYQDSWLLHNISSANINSFFGNLFHEIANSSNPGGLQQCLVSLSQIRPTGTQLQSPTSIVFTLLNGFLSICKFEMIPKRILDNIEYIILNGFDKFVQVQIFQVYGQASEVVSCLDGYFKVRSDASAAGTQLGKCISVLLEKQFL